MVTRLQRLGVPLEFDDVLRQSKGAAVGRPHVARAIVTQGSAIDVSDAFDRYIGRGKAGFVAKQLPPLAEVCARIREAGGVSSAAHLKERGTRSLLQRFRDAGLDGIETRHPSHQPETRATLTDLALELGLLRTGGSDWHGDGLAGESHGPMGSQDVPLEWLGAMDARLHQLRSM
jgi:predicted metal-dependent phosphoesterase TrpH